MDAITQYATDVLDGKLVTGPHVRSACERHMRDLKRDDIYFDLEEAEKLFGFYENRLTLLRGPHEGQPFVLLSWQKFVMGSTVGWKRTVNGLRRFRRVYVETGKGTGKTPMFSGFCLYQARDRNNPRSNIFVTARDFRQAVNALEPAKASVQNSEFLEQYFELIGGNTVHTIYCPGTMSSIVCVASETQGAGRSGYTTLTTYLDEYHEHPTNAMLEMNDLNTKNTPEPLALITTNAGFDLHTPCGEEHLYAVAVARGKLQDDEFLSYVCAMDEGDNPFEDPSCWIKTQPSLPQIPGENYIASKVKDARNKPGVRALFNRLLFCVWTRAESPWFDPEEWKTIEVRRRPKGIVEGPCYGGLDLARKTDLAALAVVFERPERQPRFFGQVKIWTPETTIEDKESELKEPYPEWVDKGYIIATPGPVIDFEFIASYISQLRYHFPGLYGIAYDRWGMDILEGELAKFRIDTTRDPRRRRTALLLCPHDQSFRAGPSSDRQDSSEPRRGGGRRGAPRRFDTPLLPLYMPRSVNAVEEQHALKQLSVLFNPALRSAASGAVVISDASENRRLHKIKSTVKIDPIVALTQALGLAVAEKPKDDATIYSDGRGLTIL